MENGFGKSEPWKGLLREGHFSPLLSNLVLDESTGSMERPGTSLLRYADDCNIYVRSERAGQRVMESVTQFITRDSSSR